MEKVKSTFKNGINPSASRRVDHDQQTIVLDGEERIHVSPLCDYGNREYTITNLYDDVTTLYEGFLRGERVSNDGPCLGWRPDGESPYQWMTYSQVREKAKYFGSGLLTKGFEPSTEAKIGIFSQNRPEWVITDLGCNQYSIVVVPLYSTLGPEGYEYIINLTEMTLIVVDNVAKASGLLERAEELPTLKHIVVMDTDISDEVKGRASAVNVELVSFQEMLELGENNVKELSPSQPDDLAMIRFTSGTTGVPKGALATQKMIIANVSGIYSLINPVHSCAPGSVSISFLPLAHVYEHTLEAMLFQHGCSVGFFRGDVKTLVNDMQVLKPEIFPAVPRLANKLHDSIMSNVSSASFIKRGLFNLAYYLKKGDLDKGILRKDTWCDTIVFRKVQDILGGNVKWMITGSAPIDTEVIEFFQVVFGVQISEAYGQTECTAASNCTIPGETISGHVGSIIPSAVMKVVDVPEMGYLASQGKGEVCMKGVAVFPGYYKNPEKTAEAIDQDGWLHSGDIGEWLPNGALKIIDRKKHVYKLSQGEYVAPEKIELVLTRSPLIAQAFVYGESLKSFNIALIVPDEDALKKFAANNNLTELSLAELCQNKTVRDAVTAELERTSNAAKLCGFERVRGFVLLPELFSIENGLLTPTMKNKRLAIRDCFKAELDAMYDGQVKQG